MNSDVKKIIITRYNSRRLYNTITSEYITLEQISELIRKGKEVQIIDKDTNEDLTNQYLLQIISEHESRGGNTLPNDILIEIIKNYNDATQNVIPEMLSQTFNFIKQNHDQFLSSFNTNLNDETKKFDNSEMVKNWNDFQSNMMNNVMSPWFGSKKKETNFNENSQSNSDNNGENNNNFNHKTPNFQYKSEIDLMKEQIEALQKQLNENNKK